MHPDTSPPQAEAEQQSNEEGREIDFVRLDAFGEAMAKTRSEAIQARQTSGIEQVWAEDEEYYEGIDDANRHEERAVWRDKPPGRADVSRKKSGTDSHVFPNITGPFVEAGAARLGDMLFPSDDSSWRIDPTPIPDLVRASKAEFTGEDIREANMAFPGNPEAAQQHLKEIQDIATQRMKEAKTKAKAAGKRIEDWLKQCQWHAQGRAILEDCARVGCGVIKGPVPHVKEKVAWMPASRGEEGSEQGQVTMQTIISPQAKRIDYWNLYPAKDCGDNIHNGNDIWERDTLSRRQVRGLLKQKDNGYIPEQIHAVLKEGPHHAKATYERIPEIDADTDKAKSKYEIWYFQGTAEREDLEAFGCDCGDEADVHVDVMLEMINNRVVKIMPSLFKSGRFTYNVMVWRKRANYWAGIGLAREIRVAQQIVTAATRQLMDNAGIAAGPMLILRQGTIIPADGKHEIRSRKIWYIAEDADTRQRLEDSIGYVKVDMMVNELLAIIELGLKFAELVTGMPMLLQGQVSQSTPDTLGGQQLFQNNASITARRIAKLFDDLITEPQIEGFYEWLLLYGDNEDEKGDYIIDATGSSALVEREIQNQELTNVGALVLDPRFGKDPERWMNEWLKSRHLDPKNFEFEDEEKKQAFAQATQGPPDTSLEVAQLRGQVELQKKDIDAQLTQLEIQAEAQQKEADRELQVLLAAMEQEVKEAKLRGDGVINADKIKAALAQTTMRLNTQARLAGVSAASAPQVARPATEPEGRAPAGEAFQK